MDHLSSLSKLGSHLFTKTAPESRLLTLRTTTDFSYGTVNVVCAVSVIFKSKEQCVYLKFTMPF